jgi:hypothetical protein
MERFRRTAGAMPRPRMLAGLVVLAFVGVLVAWSSTDEPDHAGAPDATDRAEAPPRSFTIAAAGDILPHTAVIESAAAAASDGGGGGGDGGGGGGADYDFRPMFAQVAPVFRAADLAVCHLEAPLSADNRDVFGGGDRRTPDGAPRFLAPFQLADAIVDAGFDACSTAHNHSSDAGPTGIRDTIELLEDAGVVPAGTAATPDEAGTARLHEVEGVTVAHLAATYGLNEPLPDDEAWMVDDIDVEELVGAAGDARQQGAEFVVVSLHHGLDYQIEPSTNQRERTDALLASDEIDLLLGHHAHVVQPIERVHDKVAVHGLGNLLSNMHPDITGPETQDGVIVALEVVEDVDGETDGDTDGETDGARFSVEEVAYVPTRVERDRHEIVDVGAALATETFRGEPLDDDHRAELEASWDRTVEAITLEGADAWGVVPRSGPELLEPGHSDPDG